MGKAVIAIHGGAGAISRAQMTPAREREYVAALSAIVDSGQKMLAAGASALDTVTEAVRLLEECPLFNAGIGSVFTRDSRHELDACVMDGYSLQAGAVAGVQHLRNPVLAARLVLEQSPHVLLIGEGAEAFAASRGMARVDNSLFSTPEPVCCSCVRRRRATISCSITTPRRWMNGTKWAPSARSRWIWRATSRRRPPPAA